MFFHLKVTNFNEAELWQFDVSSAFLNNRSPYFYYYELPVGHAQKHDNSLVWRSPTSINGNPDSDCIWYNTITQKFEEFGLIQVPNEPCLFIKRDEKKKLSAILVLYVDHFLLTAKENILLIRFLNLLKQNSKLNQQIM